MAGLQSALQYVITCSGCNRNLNELSAASKLLLYQASNTITLLLCSLWTVETWISLQLFKILNQILVSVNKRMIIQLQASLGFFTEFYIAKYFTNKKSFNSKHGYIQVFFLCIASCKGTFTDNGRVTADVNVDGWWKKSKTAPHWR